VRVVRVYVVLCELKDNPVFHVPIPASFSLTERPEEINRHVPTRLGVDCMRTDQMASMCLRS
jgi:hypothetical protein